MTQALRVQEMPIDVWIDAHHLVRRVAMTLALSLPSAPSMQETVTVDLGDYGPQPRPLPPPASEVSDLTGLLGAVPSG
jgi:hypothetical protein